MFLATVLLLGAALLVVGVIAVLGLATLRTDIFDLNARCQRAAFSCGVLGGLLVSLVPIILAVLTLLLWRLRRVRDHYQGLARDEPHRLVQTTLAAKDIVGRSDLCDVIQLSLDNRAARRPHVLVGGVGVGKTAVLVRLTSRLAAAGAVPVPVRLRDARDELDFLELARRRFRREVESRLLSADEGDKIWRELLEQDRIVVLADGLEEALVDGKLERARDTAIRAAVAHAHGRRLPLVITSRPHDALRYLDAALLQVEPLPEAAAARYIRGGRAEANPKIDLIVEKGEVVETPLYMRIARELNEAGRLRNLDTRLVTRLALRVRLLDAWTAAVAESHIYARVAVPPGERKKALADLELLACLGLAKDTLEVTFDSLAAAAEPKPPPAYEPILAKQRGDFRAAASIGGRVDLVEPLSDGVRFRHSIMQAYLGSKALPRVLDDTDYLNRALTGHEGQGPGRELIMSLVMLCFRERRWRDQVHKELTARAQGAWSAKAVDMVAAAVEIEGMRQSETAADGAVASGTADGETAHDLRPNWQATHDRETEEAKLRATSRFGELGRGEPRGVEHAPRAGTTAQPAELDRATSLAAHKALWWIGEYRQDKDGQRQDECYAVRLAAAQQIGAGGSLALEALRCEFHAALEAAQASLGARARESDPGVLRRFALQGWVLPMLAGTVDAGADADELKQLIRDWVSLLRTGVNLSVEISWAQGFKFEANRRGREVNLAMRDFLVEQAESFNEKARFWLSRMSLLHAFTPWVLEGERQEALSATVAPEEEAEHQTRLRRVLRRGRGEIADAVAKRRVSSWVGDRSHPFVEEAARLCEQALASRQPGSFLWIDEAGVVSKLGPRTPVQEEIADSRMWISPAAGWLALHSDAQRLVADVVLLLNLAERGDPATHEQRLERTSANGVLPACLTVPDGRAHMRVGDEQNSRSLRPGSTCRAGCDGHFCPYPVPGNAPFRGELSEAFCRGQRQILERTRRTAPWQSASPKELARFWADVERRARIEA